MDELTQYYYSIYPGLVSAMETEGIDPRWAGIVAPQVMIETSWGKSPATKHHNYFGMKAAKDQNGVTFSTNEGYGDDTIRIRDSFLAFPSREEGLRQGVRRLRDKFNAFEGKPSTEQYVKNINSNPEQIYFTGNPEDYINNINNIKNGSRAKAAVKQYAKDVRNTFLKAQSPAPNPSDATRVVKPQPIFTPRGDVKKAMQDKVDYHNFMNSISIKNNPQPVYNPPMKFDDGGRISDKQYYYIMEKVAEDNYRKWGFSTPDEALTHALNDNTYNYRGFYDKYPHSKADADTHWTDEFKTVWHPTFSDESIYSGNKSQFNPQGIHGGHWYGENFVPSVEQVIENNSYSDGGELYHPKQWNDLTMAEKAEMMKVAVQNGITTLPEIREKYNEFATGGYIPSDRIKDRITHYEGKAMTGAIDPLSGKYSKNNSFESEAKGFYNALPEDIRDLVLSNPELADSLYSYSYNVGAGNFKKRVVPTLRRYYQGNATVSDIEKSMWASGDSKLRGLQRRRAEERAGVRSALAGNNPIYPTMSSDSESLPFTPFYNEIFNTPLSSYNVPTVTLPIEEPLVQAAEDYAYSKEALDRQERQDRLNAFNMLLSMSNPNSSSNSLMDTVGMLTGRNFAQGGRKYDGLTQNNQRMVNPYKPNGGFYYINSEGQAVNPTSRDTIELPEAVVVAKHNSPGWYNREVVQDWDNNGNRVTYEGIQPLVMSATEWARSHSANDLHKMDPYGEIPWNAAAVATGLLAGEVATPYVVSGVQRAANTILSPKQQYYPIIQRSVGNNITTGTKEETAKAVEKGRKTLLDWVRSPFYKARLEDEPLYRVADDIATDAAKMIEEVPIDISKTKSELDPSGLVNGITRTRPAKQTQLPNGTIFADLNTGLDVNVASDLGKEADETALHELLHYMTANSKGEPVSKAGEKIVKKGWLEPTETHFDAINIIHKNRSKSWQDYILDQNNSLLPQYDTVVKMVMENPDKAVSFLEQAGRSKANAKAAVQSLRARYSEWYDIQEQRAYLQQLFHSKIKPNLKNPNDAAEIEAYLTQHPDILNDYPAYKYIQEVRPGSLKDYAKYFSAALGTTPLLYKTPSDNEK